MSTDRIDAHHHLWDLSAVHYPWLMARGVTRFFGDPTPIQRNYLLDEFRRDATGFGASVHIQVGAEDGMAEARWVQAVADATPDWPLVQVVFCGPHRARPPGTARCARGSAHGARRAPDRRARTG